MTPAQMRIAADMCEARKVHLDKDSTPDEVEAADFIFEHGLFYSGPGGCDAYAKMFRAEADKLEASS